jgi:predicted metallo-beta-lactamase superfamily hydrolase
MILDMSAFSLPTATAEATQTPKKRGRKPLPPEERERRRSAQAEKNRIKQDARRRALAILAHRHSDEFQAILNEELKDNK